MQQLSISLLDPAVVEEVPLDLWRRLFDAVGWPSSLTGTGEGLSHDSVAGALRADLLGDELIQAIEALHLLGTEAGADAILEALADQHLTRAELGPGDAGERALALELFLVQRLDAAMTEVFVRARVQAETRGAARAYHDFMGREPRSVRDPRAKAALLSERTLSFCRERDLGSHVQVRCIEDDGSVMFSVIRSHRMRAPLAVLPGTDHRAAISFYPVHGDVLWYDAGIGRLRISARSPVVVRFYCTTVGQVLFGDETFFTGGEVCSLRVLQERGRAALEASGVAGVGTIRMTECLWERGSGDLLHLRGPDCFRQIESLRLPFSEGRVLQAKLKVPVTGRSTRPVTVNVRAPSRIEVSQKQHETLIERVLKGIGIHTAGRRVLSDPGWSLTPLSQRLEDWRGIFGRETDELVRREVFRTVALPAVGAPESPGGGEVLEVVELETGGAYGVSQAPEIHSRSLTATEIEGLKLDPEALRLFLRERIGALGAAQQWEPQEEVLDLGYLPLGDQRIRLSYALRAPRAGLGPMLRARANGSPSVLLVPGQAVIPVDLPAALLESPLPTRDEAIRAAVAAAGLMHSVPAVYAAPAGTRLVVDTVRGEIWFDGIRVQGLTRGIPFTFVELLARNAPAALTGAELVQALSPARDDENTVVRRAKTDAMKAIRNALAGRDDPKEDPFPSAGRGGYRCAVQAYVRDPAETDGGPGANS